MESFGKNIPRNQLRWILADLGKSGIGSSQAGADRAEEEEPWADPASGYIDADDALPFGSEPQIGPNGTDVDWPEGWAGDQKENWRENHGVTRPR